MPVKKLIFIIAALCALSLPAFADDSPKTGQLDPTRVVTDPRGHAFLPCGKEDPPDCAKTQTLGFFVYLALGAQTQRDPRAGPAGPDPEAAARAALGWKIYDAQAPIEISEAQRVMIRKALFANIQMPNVAYAACRMIGDPAECDKP
jgi:hypothetical protein